MRTQDLVNNIRGNLGDRSSGRIGGQATEVAILAAINLAIPHCVQEAQPDYYNRTATLALTTATRDYDLPTTDSDSDTILIKDVYSHRCYRSGGTEVTLIHLNYQEFVQRTTNYNLDLTGTPNYFALWGKENKLHLDYTPDEALTMTLYVEVFPNEVTSAMLNTPLPIDDRWNLVVEAFATKHLYLKLQQVEMYQFWDNVYERQKGSTSRQEYKKQSHNIDAGSRVALVNDPVNNPYVRSWN